MLSKKFAAAMRIRSQSLQRGVEFVTASGAIEMPLGVTKEKLKFTLGRGTDKLCVVELHATVVDTTAYDVILGMEFVTAVKGAYDAYTERFTYRWDDGEGGLQSHAISAPYHTPTPPVVAYACFGGLICSEAQLQDVVGVDKIIPGIPYVANSTCSNTAQFAVPGVRSSRRGKGDQGGEGT